MTDKISLCIGILIGIIIGFLIAGLITIFGIATIVGSLNIENINSNISVNIPFNQTQMIEEIKQQKIQTKEIDSMLNDSDCIYVVNAFNDINGKTNHTCYLK
jgi:hypothetical protein